MFRKRLGTIEEPILRQKKMVTEDLTCIGFREGQGKYRSTLGALIGFTKEGVEVDVGGGLSDDERAQIWFNQNLYLGRVFEAEARAKFASGSLRHPNFIRWRDDKSTS